MLVHLALLTCLVPAPQDAAARSEDEFDPRPFRIRDTQAARWLLDEIQNHIAARRWSEAIDGLQALIDEHASDVLGPEQARLANGTRAAQPTHYGAAPKARALLFGLPAEARQLYRQRHEPAARAALARAGEALGRRALWELARRYPLTPSGQRAAWTLGDLEWEQGHASEAFAAWGQALALTLERAELPLASAADWNKALARLTDEPGRDPAELAAIERRVRVAAQALGAQESEARSAHAQRPPGRDADTWFEPFTLPSHPFAAQARENLHAARSDSTLLVSTSLRLLALDAYTGALLWKSDEPPGWAALGQARHDFERGIDLLHAWIQPAASERVAVAALQIPVSFIDNVNFQSNINITVKIPDRRLFAFDLRTGAPLWNHMPPADWDGDAGSFVERMSVAGAPLIVGSRVLVPCHRMQGRIDYHVGCFDVDTGALLWSTDVISGQRELNMFGRPQREFSAPPLVVSGSDVIALTQLGAIACLDLYTGEVRWVTLYDQIPLPKNRDLQATPRPAVWRNQPPVVSGSAVVAAPFDSFDLVGLDLRTGTLSWSLSNRPNGTIDTLATMSDRDIDQLVGARGDTVYLAGRSILALRAPAGLALAAPLSLKWSFHHEDLERSEVSSACALADDRLVIPTEHAAVSVDLASGARVDEGLAWGDDRHDGNLLVCERELFALSNRKVCGYFDWGVLVQRARRACAEHPEDARAALALGRLLSNRGEVERTAQGKSASARATLAEARTVLEGALARGGGALQGELGAELHRVLRSQARTLADLADTRAALAALARARDLAPSPEELRDTLLEELALARRSPTAEGDERAAQAASETIYTLLDQRCAGLTLLCDPTPDLREDANPEERAFAFDPVVGAPARSTLVPLELPLALWTLFARERDAIRAQDSAHEFVWLHRILAEHADVPLFEASASERASARIGELLRSGRRVGYEPFAQQAQQEFDAALAARDRDRLLLLAQRFPFSPAAQHANDARLEWSLDAGDVAEVARIVQAELPYRWSPATASARELGLALRLSETARRAGNVELADALVDLLAAYQPAALADVGAGAGRKLSELAAQAVARRPALRLAPPATFAPGAKATSTSTLTGEFELLGRLESPEGNGRQDLILGLTINGMNRHAATIYSVQEDGPSPRWQHMLSPTGGPLESGGQNPWWHHAACTRGRILVAASENVFALDAASGQEVWSWPVPGATPRAMSLAARSGVAVLTLISDENVRLIALDAWTGALLWQDTVEPRGFQSEPLLSDTRAVSLPMIAHTTVLVRDLFTGRRIQAFELEIPASQRILEQSWIEGEHLIVPRVNESNLQNFNKILCHDLLTGERLWRINIGEIAGDRRQLTDVLQSGGKTYLVLRTPHGQDVRDFQAGLYELSTAIGAVAPIHNLRLGSTDRIVGSLPEGRPTRFPGSTVLVLSRSSTDEARVRALDLEGGELWSQGLGVRFDEIHSSPLPQPAWSESTVALGYSVLSRHARSGETLSTFLAFFDRTTGLLRENRQLEPRTIDKADQLGLYPWGGVLALRSKSRLEFLR